MKSRHKSLLITVGLIFCAAASADELDRANEAARLEQIQLQQLEAMRRAERLARARAARDAEEYAAAQAEREAASAERAAAQEEREQATQPPTRDEQAAAIQQRAIDSYIRTAEMAQRLEQESAIRIREAKALRDDEERRQRTRAQQQAVANPPQPPQQPAEDYEAKKRYEEAVWQSLQPKANPPPDPQREFKEAVKKSSYALYAVYPELADKKQPLREDFDSYVKSYRAHTDEDQSVFQRGDWPLVMWRKFQSTRGKP